MLCNCVSEGKRNALQDYQKTEGIRLVVMTPDSSHLTKSKKVSMAKCAKACSRNRRLPFTCRYVCSYGITISAACKVTLPQSEWLLQWVRKREYTEIWWFLKFLNYAFHRWCTVLLVQQASYKCFAYSCNSSVALGQLLPQEVKESWPLHTSLFPSCLLLLSFPSYSPERSSMIIKTGNASGCRSTGTRQELRAKRTSTTNSIKRKVPSAVPTLLSLPVGT